MATIAIVYFSGYGHTKKQAEAVHEGAASLSEATLYPIDNEGNLSETDWQSLAKADAIIYGSPTYMGGPAWQFKNFPMQALNPGLARNGRIRLRLALPTQHP